MRKDSGTERREAHGETPANRDRVTTMADASVVLPPAAHFRSTASGQEPIVSRRIHALGATPAGAPLCDGMAQPRRAQKRLAIGGARGRGASLWHAPPVRPREVG